SRAFKPRYPGLKVRGFHGSGCDLNSSGSPFPRLLDRKEGVEAEVFHGAGCSMEHAALFFNVDLRKKSNVRSGASRVGQASLPLLLLSLLIALLLCWIARGWFAVRGLSLSGIRRDGREHQQHAQR